MPYGIEADRRDLLNDLDNEAQLLGDEEDRRIEEVVANDAVLGPQRSKSTKMKVLRS